MLLNTSRNTIYTKVCTQSSSSVIFYSNFQKLNSGDIFFKKSLFLEGIKIFKNLRYDAKYTIYDRITPSGKFFLENFHKFWPTQLGPSLLSIFLRINFRKICNHRFKLSKVWLIGNLDEIKNFETDTFFTRFSLALKMSSYIFMIFRYFYFF